MRTVWMAMAAALACGHVDAAAVRVQRTTYHGWPGSYRLTNGAVELVFVPQIGRIMRYGYVGGANALWENAAMRGKALPRAARTKEWANYGGDKVWPAPQDRWGAWPPDPWLDGSPHRVTVLRGGRLRVSGPASPKKGVRFVREIAMDAAGTGVSVRSTIVNASRKPVRWSVWQITQVDRPDYAALDTNRRGHFPSGHYTFKGADPAPGMLSTHGSEIRLRRHPTKSAKIGSDAPSGRVSMRRGRLRLTIAAPYRAGKPYPDDGCGQEIWSNPDPLRYMELELLGPLQTLPPRGRATLTTRWQLARVGGAAGR